MLLTMKVPILLKIQFLESGIWIDDNGKYYLYISSAFPSEAIRAYLQITI